VTLRIDKLQTELPPPSDPDPVAPPTGVVANPGNGNGLVEKVKDAIS
jgi:hypothetical protein